MKKKFLATLMAMVLIFTMVPTAFASYDPTGDYGYGYNYNNSNFYYNGENYYDYNYNNGFYGNYYMSPWAEDLEIAYEPTWYESPQRQVTRGEVFLLYLRAVQRSLDRQGYSRLMAGYNRVPFSDYNSVNPYAQSEVNVLYANDILIGFEDNTMRFSQKLTRAQMAAIYSRFNRIYFNMGRGYNQITYDGYNNYYKNNYNNYYSNYMFDDIAGHWAAPDIITAASNGVLKGVGYIPNVGYNCFDTEGPLTVEQVWKILDNCVGYMGLKRSDVAHAMSQTFKVTFGKNIDESYGISTGTKITNLTALESLISIKKGESETLAITIYPKKAEYQKLEWISSPKGYITIEEAWNPSSGTAKVTIYGKKVYNSYVTLTGRAMDGSNEKVTIKVKVTDEYDDSAADEYITSITPSEDEIYLDIGESIELNAKIRPNDADYKKLSWKSNNTNIADVSDVYTSGNYSYGTITANSEGTAYVYIKAQDGSGEQAKVKVIVSDDNYSDNDSVITSAVANPSSVKMNIADTETIIITTYPKNAVDRDITWISDNDDIAIVEIISATKISIIGFGVGTTKIRGIATSTGKEICVIPVTVSREISITPDYPDNSDDDRTAPIVQIKGPNEVVKGKEAILIIEVFESNLQNFYISEEDILGAEDLKIKSIEIIDEFSYQVILESDDVIACGIRIAAGVAVDENGNESNISDEHELYFTAE